MVKKRDSAKVAWPLSIDEQFPIVETRYYVVEVTPAYTEMGYDGRNIPEEIRIVSPFFEEHQDALDWFCEHEPDEGKTLRIDKQHKRRITTEKWV